MIEKAFISCQNVIKFMGDVFRYPIIILWKNLAIMWQKAVLSNLLILLQSMARISATFESCILEPKYGKILKFGWNDHCQWFIGGQIQNIWKMQKSQLIIRLNFEISQWNQLKFERLPKNKIFLPFRINDASLFKYQGSVRLGSFIHIYW